MASDNHIVIHHQDGICRYEVEDVELGIDDGQLDVEIAARANRDCVLGFLPPPTLYIEAASVSARSLDELTHEEIDEPAGWDTEEQEKEDNIFRIYIGQHQALDHNKLVIRRRSPTEIELVWTADAPDFNYYDEKAKRNAVEIRCVFVDE